MISDNVKRCAALLVPYDLSQKIQEALRGQHEFSRIELEGLNRISEQYTAAKNAAAVEAEWVRKEAEIRAAGQAQADTLVERSRQVKQGEDARDKALGEVRPDFATTKDRFEA